MEMLDGNTAALRDYEAQQDRADRAFEAHEQAARQQLADEAQERITASDVTFADVWDQVCGSRIENDMDLALSRDDFIELSLLLKRARDTLLAERRAKHVADNLESRVWQLSRGE